MKMRGRHLGDERVRIQRVKPEEYKAAPPSRRRRAFPPALVLALGFALMIVAGTVLLILPVASASGEWTPLIDALFTATSAVCVTGLVVVDTGTYWSPFGQVVIALLIQLGGFGFMTSSTLLLLLVVRRRTRLRDRVLVQETMGRGELGDVTGLVKRIALFTFAAELVGLVVLSAAFMGHGMQAGQAAWYGLFHSISAFNNAGFDIMGGIGQSSLTGFAGDYMVVGLVGVLVILGGLGYAIVEDVLGQRRWARLALETKIVLLTSAVLLVAGMVAVATLEWDNPATLGAMPLDLRVLNALFESITARTAGFNTIATDGLIAPTALIVIALMFIGGASGSTAGGIKVNTFSVLLVAIVSTAIGRPSADAFGRRIQHVVIYRALAVALISIAFVFSTFVLLEILVEEHVLDILFEAVSAFGTVGLSRGITADLTEPARLLIIVAMYVGRLGPLTLVLALAARARPVAYRPAVESMRIG